MNDNIKPFLGNKLEPAKVLEAAIKAEFDDVLIIGVHKDGSTSFRTTSPDPYRDIGLLTTILIHSIF